MEFFYPIVKFFTAGGALHVSDPARRGDRDRDHDRALHHARDDERPQSTHLEPGRAGAHERRLRQGARAHQQGRLSDSASAEHGACPAGGGAPARRRRESGAGEHDGDRAAAREAHPLSRDGRQCRNAARPAGYGERPDPLLRRRGDRQPGGKGQPAVGEHLGGDELHGLRSHDRSSDPGGARLSAVEDPGAERWPGDGGHPLPERARRSAGGPGREPLELVQPTSASAA